MTLGSKHFLVTYKSSAIRNAGYQVVSSYCHRFCFKTDAPNDLLFEMKREWVSYSEQWEKARMLKYKIKQLKSTNDKQEIGNKPIKETKERKAETTVEETEEVTEEITEEVTEENPNLDEISEEELNMRKELAEIQMQMKKQKATSGSKRVSFEVNQEVKEYFKSALQPRFLPNPEKNWGPMSAAKMIVGKQVLKKVKKE